MSYRKGMKWPPHVRRIIGDELRLSQAAARMADEAFKIRVYLAVEQGLTTGEVAEALGISQTSASKYRIQGEALHAGRRPSR